MRFSVDCAFPRLRKRGVASRKSAFCDPAHPTPHAKAHSGIVTLTENRILRPGLPDALRKSAFWTGDVMEKRTLTAYLTKRRILCAGSHAHCAFP